MTPEMEMGKMFKKKKDVPIPTPPPSPPSKTCDPYTGVPSEESRTIKSFEVIGHSVFVCSCQRRQGSSVKQLM